MAVRSRAMVPSTASRVLIKLDNPAAQTMSGRLFCPHSGKSLAFCDVMDFTNKLDGLLDEIAFPLAAVEYRSFAPKARKRPPGGASGEKKPEEAQREGDGLDAKDYGTFVVHVQFRQNATWQGTVKWAGQNQEQRFRSALELLKIMDSVVNAEDGEE